MSVNCRFCDTPLVHTFIDLGMTPLANSYIQQERDEEQEIFYPLHAYVCDECYLVQLRTYAQPDEIFSDYAYFSSFSSSWLEHVQQYVDDVSERLELNEQSFVVELASNDGYLLQYFNHKKIPSLGVEPAQNIAKAAQAKGIDTMVDFFGTRCANKVIELKQKADLIIANNVLAHVPDLNDFVEGMRVLLADTGTVTVEFPHILALMTHNEFDTIYHEHLCYFSLLTIEKIFSAHGMAIVDVDQLQTHGGSLRIYAQHQAQAVINDTSLTEVRKKEIEHGLYDISTYLDFANKALNVKIALLQYLTEAKAQGLKIAAYGAPAKGNTLLNYCGIGKEMIDFTVDSNHEKQGRLLPGTHIPIFSPDKLKEEEPDVVLILPWNISQEISEQIDFVHNWGGKIIVPIPTIKEI